MVAIDSFAAENYVMTCKCWRDFLPASALEAAVITDPNLAAQTGSVAGIDNAEPAVCRGDGRLPTFMACLNARNTPRGECKCWTEFAAAYATLNATDVAQVEGAVNLLKKQCSTMSNGVSPKWFLVASMATLSAVLNLVVWSLLRSGDLELRAACA